MLLWICQINTFTMKEWDGCKQKLLQLALWNKWHKERDYNGFLQTNKHSTLQDLTNQPQAACYNGGLQYVLWNKHSALDMMDHFKCTREIRTDRRNALLLMSSNNRLITVDNYDISLLQFLLFWKNKLNLKECVAATAPLYHCKWPVEIMTVSFKYMAASALLILQYALNRNICQIHCI